MSTLLSDLQGSPQAGPGSSDGDLVQQIMNEMNGGVGAPPPPSPANMAANPGVISAPMSQTAMAGRVMDNAPATAHIIGGSHPTPADFAAAMHGMNGGAGVAGAPYAPPAPVMAPQVYTQTKRSMSNRFAEEFKIPLLVAFLVFVFSLPVVNFLFAHYLPSMVLPTGQLTMVGLVIKSLAAGVAYWVLQRIVVPLLSL